MTQLESIVHHVEAETSHNLSRGPNSSFSQILPTLQLAWDSTSLGALKTCPRYYYYNIVLGLVPAEESVHLTFGTLFHAGLEEYDRSRALGLDHEQSVRDAIRRILIKSWNPSRKRPWSSDDPSKNLETVMRAVVWYCDQFEDDPLETLVLANGEPAVELSFRFDIRDLLESGDFKTQSTGEDFYLCGRLDKAARWQDGNWIVDKKTTRGQIGPEYFQSYYPHNQMSLYNVAGHLIFGEGIRGLIVDVCQAQAKGNRFQRGFVTRSPGQMNEWLVDTTMWLRQAESFAVANHWPQNDSACGMYSSYDGQHDLWKNGCPYRDVCGSDPAVRHRLLKAKYIQRTWDPLVRNLESEDI